MAKATRRLVRFLPTTNEVAEGPPEGGPSKLKIPKTSVSNESGKGFQKGDFLYRKRPGRRKTKKLIKLLRFAVTYRKLGVSHESGEGDMTETSFFTRNYRGRKVERKLQQQEASLGSS